MTFRSTIALTIVAAMLCWSATAAAFCGFYVGGADAQLFNDATQVTLLRDGQTTVLSMQNNYEGPLADFAMVVPVPQVLQKENVKTLKKSAFDKIDRLTAPRLVEYWEQDPCAPVYHRVPSGPMKGMAKPKLARRAGKSEMVTVEAEFSVGEYDIVVLSAKEATALENWLKSNKYVIPDGAAPYFKPYIEGGSYFFVAKVNAKRVTYAEGKAVLSPLRFHYSSDTFQLPIRLGLINSKGKQDLLVYILAQERFELANYENVQIPTNLEVNPGVAESFGDFYEALFSRTVEENPKAVVTEYAWSATWCDPCPDGISSLNDQDFLTFGADVNLAKLAKEQKEESADGAEVMILDDSGTAKRPKRMRRPPRRHARPSRNWIVTRLHMRYGADGVGEDLIFKRGEPIEGGRETGTMVPTRRSVVSGNQFQGRYIIRHEWQGKVECEEPTYGRWGGPWPDAQKAKDTSAVSSNTRGAKLAGKVNLDTMLKKNDSPPVAANDAIDVNAEPAEHPPMDEIVPPPAKEPKATGCSSTEDQSPFAVLSMFLLALALGWRRRERH